MARKNRNFDDDYDDYDDRPRRAVKKKGMGWYGKFLLITLLIMASVVGFLVYRTYEMLISGEKETYTSPVQAQNSVKQGEVAVLTPNNRNDGMVGDLPVENMAGVEQLTPEEIVAPDENAMSNNAPMDPTNRSFDKDLENLF